MSFLKLINKVIVTTETRGCKDCWANPPSLHRGKDGDSLEIKRDKPRKRGEQGTKRKGPLVEEQSQAIIEKESSFCPELYFSAPGYHLSATLWLSSVLGTDTLLTEGGGWRKGDTEQLVVLSRCPQLSGYSSTCFLVFLTCGALRLCRHICKPGCWQHGPHKQRCSVGGGPGRRSVTTAVCQGALAEPGRPLNDFQDHTEMRQRINVKVRAKDEFRLVTGSGIGTRFKDSCGFFFLQIDFPSSQRPLVPLLTCF